MSIHKRLLLFRRGLLLFGLAAALGSAAAAQLVSVTLSTANASVRSGDRIPIRIVIKNTSDHDISLLRSPSPSLAEMHYRFTVERHDGQKVRETSYKRSIDKGVAGSEVLVTLKPGQTLEERADLAKLFDLTSPGEYQIQASRTLPSSEGDGSVGSNKLSLTVVPTN